MEEKDYDALAEATAREYEKDKLLDEIEHLNKRIEIYEVQRKEALNIISEELQRINFLRKEMAVAWNNLEAGRYDLVDKFFRKHKRVENDYDDPFSVL